MAKYTRYSQNNPLRRLGKKNVISSILAKYVPNFKCLISLFYGSGAFENNFIGEIDYIFANDWDDDVFNLYQVLKNEPDKLIDEIEMLPISESSWNYYKNYRNMKLSDVENAMFFLYYSNFGFLGMSETLKLNFSKDKIRLLENIKGFLKQIANNEKTEIIYMNNDYLNVDYLDVLRKISFNKNRPDKQNSFIFADPPYIETQNNYNTPNWTFENHRELQNYLINSEIKFMICEFDNEKILKLSKENNLYVTEILERCNLKNRPQEIIITNYKPKQEQKQLKLF